MSKVLVWFLILMLVGCDEFCSAEKEAGIQEGYKQSGLDNQKLTEELENTKNILSRSLSINEKYEKQINELRIMQDFNNRFYVAFVSSCHNFFVLNCGVVSSKYVELVKSGVTPAPGWIIGFNIICLLIYAFIACFICFLSFVCFGPRMAEIERTQKFVDDVEDAVAERLKFVSEEIFNRYEQAKIRQDELDTLCYAREEDLDEINDSANKEYENVQDLRDEAKILDAENQRRREIREILKFDYEKKVD
jgi:hypothetical protein